MTVAVTAFAVTGAGIAYSQESRPAQQAGHTAIELTAVQLPGGGPLAKQFGLSDGIGGPLGCTSYLGQPAQTVRMPAAESKITNGMGVLGTDTSEEYTNPASIPSSNEDESAGLGMAADASDEGGSMGSAATDDEGGALGSAATNDENTSVLNIPAADQGGDQTCTTASTTGGMPSGHRAGHPSGHHHGSGSGAGKHHHGTGPGSRHHHGTRPGGRHHGTGTGSRMGSGQGMGKHGKGAHSGRTGHHMTGGKAASTGAREASTSDNEASETASMQASSGAAESGMLPTTGAPLAALLGLAVAALAAGLVARRVAKRDDEAEPEEG